MLTFKTVTFSKDIKTKIQEIESELIPIYLSVYEWNFKPKTDNDRVHYTKELIKGHKAIIFKEQNRSIGFILFTLKEYKSLNFIYIHEIEILKEYRAKGYSKLLRKKLIEDYQPDVVYGESNNPISVKSRDKVMNDYEYFTYWAEEPINKEYPITNKIRELSKTSVELFDPNNLKSYKEGIKEFTIFNEPPKDENNVIPELNNIYSRIKQVSLNDYSSAFGVLISVKKDLIERLNPYVS